MVSKMSFLAQLSTDVKWFKFRGVNTLFAFLDGILIHLPARRCLQWCRFILVSWLNYTFKASYDIASCLLYPNIIGELSKITS